MGYKNEYLFLTYLQEDCELAEQLGSVLSIFPFQDTGWRNSPYLGHAILMAEGRMQEKPSLTM